MHSAGDTRGRSGGDSGEGSGGGGGGRLLGALVCLPALALVYASIASFALTVLLPCVFVLLVVRASKVERSVDEGFAQRQQVLAQETQAQKSLRFLSLLLRALPMLVVLVQKNTLYLSRLISVLHFRFWRF